MALYLVSLLAGMALGLRANVRPLIVCVVLAALLTPGVLLYMGEPLASALWRTALVLATFQAGYFAALLVRAAARSDRPEPLAPKERVMSARNDERPAGARRAASETAPARQAEDAGGDIAPKG